MTAPNVSSSASLKNVMTTHEDFEYPKTHIEQSAVHCFLEHLYTLMFHQCTLVL